ncbi:MAG TPA: deoxyribonuclease IV [bacterium]|nr:deoxyribonuclease IV [bacterium]
MTDDTPLKIPADPNNTKRKLCIGSHLSIAGGLVNAVHRARALPVTALALFTASPRIWKREPVDDVTASAFRQALRDSALMSVVAHALYLANPATPDSVQQRRTIKAVTAELVACHRLGIPWLVIHPGSHRGTGESEGIRRAADILDHCIETAGACTTGIALETTAGSGANLGGRFEHLRDIIAASRYPDRYGVCLDTCHIFAAGYDLRDAESWNTTRSALDTRVGLHRLRIIHVNDSRESLGSRKDRHAHIGKGQIGCNGFRQIVRDPVCRTVPLILETPKDPDGALDRMNIAVLKRLVVE